MTKTLTEQWREGMLPNGEYYVKDWDGTTNWFVAQNNILWRDLNNPIYASERIEVLAPVPSYDEYNELKQDNKYLKSGIETRDKQIEQLEKKLEIATKALKEINIRSQRDWDEYDCMGCARKALYDIEMEGVK